MNSVLFYQARGSKALAVDLGYLPSRARQAQAGVTAGLEAERAVVIQMGARYAAEDSKDREVVADDHQRFLLPVLSRDPVQSFPGAPLNVHESFAAGDS